MYLIFLENGSIAVICTVISILLLYYISVQILKMSVCINTELKSEKIYQWLIYIMQNHNLHDLSDRMDEMLGIEQVKLKKLSFLHQNKKLLHRKKINKTKDNLQNGRIY